MIMDNLGKKSTAYICYLIVNAWWYLSCIVGAIIPPFLIYDYFLSNQPGSVFNVTLPLKPSLVTLNEGVQNEFINIDSVKVALDFDYLLQHSPLNYLIWSIIVCVSVGIFLYGLYQLRNLLKQTVSGSIFTAANVQRVKTIAILLIIVDPLLWIVKYFIRYSVADMAQLLVTQEHTIRIGIPMVDGDWIFIIAGLLVYTLAAIFEKGNEMYQELKLTV